MIKKLIALLVFVSGVAQGQGVTADFKGLPITRTLEYRPTDPIPYASISGPSSPIPLAELLSKIGTITGSDSLEVLFRKNNMSATIGDPFSNNIEVNQTNIKTPVRVAVDDKGLLKTIDAFKVITKQESYWGPGSCPGYPQGQAMGFGRGVVASCAVAHFQKYTKDLEYHYEDKDGNVLKEVRALTGN